MKKYGSQAPTKSVILDYEKSEYLEAIELYEKSGRVAQEWQKNIIKSILAKNDEDLWTHTKIGYSLPRRNGKSEILIIRELYGLFKGEIINHTAHRTTTSHSAWEKLCMILDKMDVKYKSLRAIGRERIELPDTGGKIEFRTRTTTGGLGEGFDLLIIDEAQEYTDDQESALKYVVTDSKNPQTIMCGTPPTPLSSGTVFLKFREKVLEEQSENFMWAEWSVDEETDPYDTDSWYKTNPSLGTIFTERSVKDEIGTDVLDFNIQRLGLWITYNQKSVISAQEWEVLKTDNIPPLDGKLHVGIKYGNDGKNVALSIAAKTLDDKVFIESIDCQNIKSGNDWIIDFISKSDIATVTVDGAIGQGLLSQEMLQNGLKKPILPKVADVISANAMWEQSIVNEEIIHCDQPSLTQVVTNCSKRPIGNNGGFGYKSQYEDMDIALMDSAMLALYSCKTSKQKTKQKVWY